MELPLWRLSCNFTGSNGEMDLAMENKGTPHMEGDSSSPMRAKTAILSSRQYLAMWVLLLVWDITWFRYVFGM